jgi:voltage-gated potassium channel
MATPVHTHESHHAFRQVKKDFVISLLAIISVCIGIYDMARPRKYSHFTPLDGFDLFIVLIFIVDFLHSAHTCGDWRLYAKNHWYEIPALLPITGSMVKGSEAVPLLRGIRLVRVARMLRLLRVAGTAARLKNFWSKVLRVARRAHLYTLFLSAAVFILISAVLAWLFEGPTNPAFREGNSIWWAINMFSNVAYVDFQPATAAGRVIAGILEFSGIGFIGLFTASLANAFLNDKHEEPAPKKPLD